MNTLKRILLVLAVIIGVALIVGLFMPSGRHLERSISVNAPPALVFEQVNNLKNWEKWSPWYEMDPNAKQEFSTPASGAGAYFTWDSENRNVGKGKMTLEESTPPQAIKFRLDFDGMTPAYGHFNFQPEGDGTKVVWSFDADMGNMPWAKLFGPMMEKMVGGNFEHGLEKMKTVSETAKTNMPVEQSAMSADTIQH